MRDVPRRPDPGDETSGTPKAPEDKSGQPSEARTNNKPSANEPVRRPGRPPGYDPNGLQALLDYRDERARTEARLLRAKRLRHDDRHRAGVPEPDDPSPTASPGRSSADGKSKQGDAVASRGSRAHEPLRGPRPGQPVDPEGLQALLDYRDQRARAEAKLGRAKQREYDDRRRASVPEADDPSPAKVSSHSMDQQGRTDQNDAGQGNSADDAVRDDEAPRLIEPRKSDKPTAADRARRLQADFPDGAVADLGFHPAHERGSLGEHFRPGILDPHGEMPRKINETPKVAEKELKIVEYLVERRGALVTVLPEDKTPDVKNPDAVVRWNPADEGGTVEFKTPASQQQSALEQNIRRGSTQVSDKPDPQLVIDGRGVDTTESAARGAWAKRHRLSPATTPTVHFILGDGRWLTLPEEPREKRP